MRRALRRRCCSASPPLPARSVRAPAADAARAAHQRMIAIVTADSGAPHLYSAFPEGVPRSSRPTTCTRRCRSNGPRARRHCRTLAGRADRARRVHAAAARRPGRARRRGRDGAPEHVQDREDPRRARGIRRAQSINEEAVLAVEPLVAPGVRGTELSGAFLRRIFELGATGNTVDPIWQIMPACRRRRPRTPLPVTSCSRHRPPTGRRGGRRDLGRHRHRLRGIRPTSVARSSSAGPGTPSRPGSGLARSSTASSTSSNGRDRRGPRARATTDDGRRPWLHLYLAHGIGTNSAEMPWWGPISATSSTARSCSRPAWCWCSSRSCGLRGVRASGPRRSSPSPTTGTSG